MPYIIPTASAFKARFPEFTSVDDLVVGTFLTAAANEGVDAALWMERDYQIAVMALAAHFLSLYQQQMLANALPGGSSGGGGGSGSDLITYISSIRWDDKTISYGAKKATETSTGSGGGSGSTGAALLYEETPYGMYFVKLRRRNIPTIMAT